MMLGVSSLSGGLRWSLAEPGTANRSIQHKVVVADAQSLGTSEGACPVVLWRVAMVNARVAFVLIRSCFPAVGVFVRWMFGRVSGGYGGKMALPLSARWLSPPLA